MLLELDGSFVISGNVDQTERAGPSSAPSANVTRWHVNGHLFDFNGRLHRLELSGTCPPATFDELLRSVGWPRQPLVFELVREGIAANELEFRRIASL